jgi:hypothetical protein
MSENQSGVSSVRKDIAIVAGPRGWSDTRESWLSRVPRKVSTVSFRTVKALWYGEIDDPMHWAARDIRREAEVIQARREASALAAQYRTIIGGMRAKDEDFYSAEINRLERIAGELGDVDRAGTEGQ